MFKFLALGLSLTLPAVSIAMEDQTASRWQKIKAAASQEADHFNDGFESAYSYPTTCFTIPTTFVFGLGLTFTAMHYAVDKIGDIGIGMSYSIDNNINKKITGKGFHKQLLRNTIKFPLKGALYCTTLLTMLASTAASFAAGFGIPVTTFGTIGYGVNGTKRLWNHYTQPKQK